MVSKGISKISAYQHFEYAPFPVVICSAKGLLIQFANRVAQPLLRISLAEAEGQSITQVLPDIFTNDVSQKVVDHGLRNEPYTIVEKQLTYANNGKLNVVWFDVTTNPLLNKHGKLIGIITYFCDVSHRVAPAKPIDQQQFTNDLEAKVIERTTELSNVNELLQQRNEDLHKAQSVLQQVIDSSIELIAVIDRDLKFLAVNKAFENFVHKSRGELIGKEIFVAYGGARGSKQVQLLDKAFAGETLHLRVNPSIARADVWFDTHYVPLRLNEKVESVIVLSRDITGIIKSEQGLAEANRQLKEAQRLAKLGSWEWDVTTGTVIWSDEMYHIYGYEEKFPVDFVKATERMSPEDADRSSKRTQEYIQRAIENFRNQGETVYEVPSSEIRIKLPNGENKLLRNTGKIQLTPEGKLHRFLGVLQDITQIRSAEEKLRQLIDELNIKNSELESFNYVASHDLKEPLRNIRTMIDLIRLKKSEDTSTYLDKIDRAAERMFQLIESILKLSEVSNTEIEFSEVDLNKVIDTCKADLETRVKDTNAEIRVDKLPNISGNESQIAQVFSNLLSNSLKFCTTKPKIELNCQKVSGADIKSVFAGAATNGQYWCISISDNGIGFDPQYKQRIFEPFQRLHGRSEYAGTGIGLSIVRKIIEKHKGFIDVFSEIGKGSTFKVYFPA
jgi:PAS domain S-box-containing protein